MNRKWEIGLIRVVTQDDPAMRELHGQLIMDYFPALAVETRCIPDQYEGIHDPASKAAAIPKIIAAARAFTNKAAIIVSCADDPGVEELRRLLDIPVIGAGSSTAALAGRYGGRTGLLGITDYAPSPFAEGLGDALIHLGRPEGVENTLDLLRPEGWEAVEALARRLKDAGAGSLALACTGLSTVGAARKLRAALGIPVVDPVMAEGLFAYYECLQQ